MFLLPQPFQQDLCMATKISDQLQTILTTPPSIWP